MGCEALSLNNRSCPYWEYTNHCRCFGNFARGTEIGAFARSKDPLHPIPLAAKAEKHSASKATKASLRVLRLQQFFELSEHRISEPQLSKRTFVPQACCEL